MKGKQSYIPYKVILGYFLLIGLVSFAGYLIYSENSSFSLTEDKVQIENEKLLKVSSLLSKMNETESQARLTVLSDSEKEYQNYLNQTKTLNLDIDTLKTLLTTKYQLVLLDSVKYLLSKKTNTIEQLKIIKNKTTEEIAVKNAISDLTKMEVSLQKLRLEDFVKDPNALGEYQRNVLKKYVAYLNQNIPNDDTNTLSQKALDSMLVKSRDLLNTVKRETTKRNETLNTEEKKLLENELLTSEQLRKIIRLIENEIVLKTTQNNLAKEKSLKKTNQVVTITAVIGLLLTVIFSVLILNDFSKSQSYKKQLEIASLKTKNLLRNREQLIATVSHDLKTPLNIIVGYSELLSNSQLTNKQLHFTNAIKNSSDYISQLVTDLVDLTQLESGKISLNKQSFSLDKLLTETAKSIQNNYPKKTIDLQLHLDEKLNQNIVSDAFRIKQIATNIIGNAFKFTETGFIKITANVNSELNIVVIKIADSGIGIETSKQKLVFDEFTQANEKIEKKYGGSGLGLSISKKLTEILGGSLQLKSELQKGSTFILELPIDFDQQISVVSSSEKKIQASDYKLIVIDDDQNLLQLTTELLKQKGFQTFSFSDASEALQFVKENNFDLVVTDIQMPELDGFDFLKNLKSEKNYYTKQPILAVTGRTDLPKSDYISAGFKTVIAKPYQPSNFLKIIENVVQNIELDNFMEEKPSENDEQKLYSLDNLKAFFPDENSVVQEIVTSFISNTTTNMLLLEKYFSENNLSLMKELAHKMYPMFRQIESNFIANLLEELDQKTNSIAEAKELYFKIKERVNVLLIALQAEIV